jgi:hypothetical protein
MTDTPVDGLRKAARRVLWEAGRLEREGAPRPTPSRKYVLVREECRKCTGGVYELLYVDGDLFAGTVERQGDDCSDRCLEKFGGQRLTTRIITEAEADQFYMARSGEHLPHLQPEDAK